MRRFTSETSGDDMALTTMNPEIFQRFPFSVSEGLCQVILQLCL
jgi:hypothetical protein